MELYLDTGVLAAYYAPEPASAEAEGLVRATPHPAISDLSEVELFAAITRKLRRAELALTDARRIRAAFLAHLDAALYARVPLGREHYLLARDWAGRESVGVGPRGALHLAAAALSGRTLATLDPALAAAAAELGVEALPVEVEDGEAASVHEPPSVYGGDGGHTGRADRAEPADRTGQVTDPAAGRASGATGLAAREARAEDGEEAAR
jgi:hypothetical protein